MPWQEIGQLIGAIGFPSAFMLIMIWLLIRAVKAVAPDMHFWLSSQVELTKTLKDSDKKQTEILTELCSYANRGRVAMHHTLNGMEKMASEDAKSDFQRARGALIRETHHTGDDQ